jgi:hypothetical protein
MAGLKPWRKRLKRFGLVVLAALPVAVIGLWIAVHRYPRLGPAIADGLRSIIGTDAVSWLEEVAYGIEDRWNSWWRSEEEPKAYWETPSEPARSASPPKQPKKFPEFRPADVGPLFKALAAKGDGVWVPVPDPKRANDPPAMYKTLLHPDRKRPWAELFLVAVDLRRVELRAMAGTAEPRSLAPGARDYQRSGRIPANEHARLLAAFNGGFKSEHGQWGMRVDGVTLVAPRAFGCTFASERDGKPVIDAWEKLAPRHEELRWWRQGPPCMYLDGKRHGALWDPDARGWGAALGGDTVIRRSAVGLDASGKVLYLAVTNYTIAQALADGMHHAGAVDVAQLDVNWSYPKIVMFPQRGTEIEAESLFQGFMVEPAEYLREASPRDFFYLLHHE